MRHNGNRTAPFPGFSRGLPIPRGVPLIGQQKPGEFPPGVHFYQVSALVKRDGCELDAETLELQLPRPITGADYAQMPNRLADQLLAAEPEKPRPRVVLLNVFRVGFITNDQLEEFEKSRADGQAEPQAPVEVPGA